MSHGVTEDGPIDAAAQARSRWSPAEVEVLDAVRRCCDRWGLHKVTIDDIVKDSGVSRATIYRLFPGGRDVLLEAHRVYELDQFFAVLLEHLSGAADLDDLLVRAITNSLRELRSDEHLALMLASEPGTVHTELTVEGLPRIIRVASAYLVPLLDPYMSRREGRHLVDVLVRLVISYFLVPSDLIDLTDPDQTRQFIHPFLGTLRGAPDHHTTVREAAPGTTTGATT